MLNRRAPGFTQGPIIRAELAYQRRTGAARRWRRLAWRALVWLALALAFVLAGGELAAALTQRDPTPITQRLGVLPVALMVFTGTLHFGLMLRALVLSANSIVREKQAHTWDTLVLTGVDAQQIVLGKWWATARLLLPLYMLLGVLRACVVVWFGAAGSRSLLLFYATYGGYIPAPEHLLPHPLEIVLCGLAVFGLTLCNLGFTAACGVLASALAGSPTMALVRAIFLRLGILAAAALLLAVQMSLFTTLLYTLLPAVAAPLDLFLRGVLGRAAGLLLDNGMSLGELASYQMFVVADVAAWVSGTAAMILLAALLAAGMYALLAWLLLRTAQRYAVSAQALPPRRVHLSRRKKATA